MTREFHIKGISGLIIFIVMALMFLLLLIAIPSALFMVLWNAVVFEGLKGPAIQFFQGGLLALMTAMALKTLLQPTIEVHFRKATAEELSQFHSLVESHRIETEPPSSVMAATDATLAEQPVEISTK